MGARTSVEELQQFAREWMDAHKRGMVTADLAKQQGRSLRNCNTVRRRAEEALGIVLPPLGGRSPLLVRTDHIEMGYRKGVHRFLVGSDWHIWPGQHSKAEELFLHVAKTHKLAGIVLLGDVTDQACISRHAREGREEQPELMAEIEAAQARLKPLEDINCRHIWTVGNHDERLERFVLQHAADVHVLAHFDDLFPKWEHCMSADVNGAVMFKHNYHGGIHAAYNNVLKGRAKCLLTGHTHRLLMRRYTDFQRTCYAIETGTLADEHGPQFSYLKNNARDWQQGFCVLDVEVHKDGSVDVHPELVDCTVRHPRLYGQKIT